MRTIMCALIVFTIVVSLRAQSPVTPREESRKYSIEMKAKGVRGKDQSDNVISNAITGFMTFGGLGMAYKTMKTPENPDAYMIIRIKGEGTLLIPEKLKSIDDRTVLINFACPAGWDGKEVFIEVWKDNGNSDAFWKAILSTIAVDVQSGATPRMIPVEATTKITVKSDRDTFKDVILVCDTLIATCKTKLPTVGQKADASLVSTVTAFGVSRDWPLGELTIENHAKDLVSDRVTSAKSKK